MQILPKENLVYDQESKFNQQEQFQFKNPKYSDRDFRHRESIREKASPIQRISLHEASFQ